MRGYRLCRKRSRMCFVFCFIGVALLMYRYELFFAQPVYQVFQNDIHEEPCTIPVQDPFDPSIKKFIWKPKPFVCDQTPSIVHLDKNNVLHVNKSALEFFKLSSEKDISCSAESVKRLLGDDKVVFGDRLILKLPAQLDSDVTHVECKSGPRVLFDKCVAGMSNKREAILERPIGIETEEQLSVLLLGVDSVSRSASIRGLPKTLAYLKTLGSYDFRGYMKIADNTHPNLFGLLTGKHLNSNETPNITTFMDKWPYLWANFSSKDYVTLFGEDTRTTSFLQTTELKGFLNAPTDHYFKPFWVATHQRNSMFNFVSREVLRYTIESTQYTICEQNMKKYMETLNYLKLFLLRYQKRRKFSFTFLTTITHDDSSYLTNADIEFMELFHSLKEEGVLERSIVIFFADHGTRYNRMRNTVAGRVESRMPMLHVLIPEHIKTKYPQIDASFKTNTQRLVSAFDIHQTLVDILNTNYRSPSTQVVDGHKRGISLFKEISPNRSCKEAGIPPEHCSCYKSEAISLTNNHALSLVAERLVAHINNIVAAEPKCKKLTLHKIISAEKMSAGLKYVQSIHNGYSLFRWLKPETTSAESHTILIETKPGFAKFDVSCLLDSKGTLHSVVNVERTNAYGNQSHCVTSGQLKQYCFC